MTSVSLDSILSSESISSDWNNHLCQFSRTQETKLYLACSSHQDGKTKRLYSDVEAKNVRKPSSDWSRKENDPNTNIKSNSQLKLSTHTYLIV
jgi:hypothetical protein